MTDTTMLGVRLRRPKGYCWKNPKIGGHCVSFAGLNLLRCSPCVPTYLEFLVSSFKKFFQTINQSRLTTWGDTLTTPVRQGLPLLAPRLTVESAFRFQVKRLSYCLPALGVSDLLQSQPPFLHPYTLEGVWYCAAQGYTHLSN